MIGAAICLPVFGLIFPWMKVPIIVGLCYGLAALGVAVLMRAGQVSFGHAHVLVASQAIPSPSSQEPIRTRRPATRCGGCRRRCCRRRHHRTFRRSLSRDFLRNAQSGALDGAVFSAGEILRDYRRYRRAEAGTPAIRRVSLRSLRVRDGVAGNCPAGIFGARWLVQRYFGNPRPEKRLPASKPTKLASNTSECRRDEFSGTAT